MTKCKHLSGLMCGGNTVCKAGIDVRMLTSGGNSGWLRRIPCNTEHNTDIVCPKFQALTKEEREERDREMEKAVNELIASMDKIDVASIKAKHPNGGSGEIPCPVCRKKLMYQVSSYNGHFRARCETDNCINIME